MARTFKPIAIALAREASDKKAEDILLLDVRRQSPVAEYMLIATVTSPPHLEAVEEAVRKLGKELGVPAIRRARPQSSSWRVLDFGGLFAHFMTEDARKFYMLEKLYSLGRPVAWEADAAPVKAPDRRKKAKRG